MHQTVIDEIYFFDDHDRCVKQLATHPTRRVTCQAIAAYINNRFLDFTSIFDYHTVVEGLNLSFSTWEYIIIINMVMPLPLLLLCHHRFQFPLALLLLTIAVALYICQQ